jgi:dephospho-CoA kinase
MTAYLVTGNPGSGKTTVSRLEKILRECQVPVVICGIALNIPHVADLFDRIFLLRIDGSHPGAAASFP